MSEIRVSTGEFIKNYGTLADKALVEPLTITKNGRDRFVMMSAEEYSRLKRRDRRVVKVEDFTDQEIAQIASAKSSPEDAALDQELVGWKP